MSDSHQQIRRMFEVCGLDPDMGKLPMREFLAMMEQNPASLDLFRKIRYVITGIRIEPEWTEADLSEFKSLVEELAALKEEEQD